MTKKQPIENSQEFLDLIKSWQALEDKTITSADELISKTTNPLVKMIMEMIKHDSEKHKLIQQMIVDNITKEAVHISPDELIALSDQLNKHMQAEGESPVLPMRHSKRVNSSLRAFSSPISSQTRQSITA